MKILPLARPLPIVLAASAALLATACGKSNRTVITNKGSDTMLEVAQAWAEKYQEVEPEVYISVQGGGSGGGIAAMIDGTVDIANCSRLMKDKEIVKAEAKDHEPILHKVGFDGIAIYVHKDNPIESITLEQLRQIYGQDGEITEWSQVGVTLPGTDDQRIKVVSRDTNSGTYEFFKEGVLGEGRDFRLDNTNLAGSKDVVHAVEQAITAIGYSGLAYATPAVRIVPVVNDQGTAVTPSIETVIDGSYPISRPLYMYSDGQPKAHVKAYLDWIKSDDGQRILQANGYPPLRKL